MIIAFLLFILVSLRIGFHQIFKQQGRLLLRLDQLEQHGLDAQGSVEKPGEQAQPGGLPLQSDFPAFSFPDLAGRAVALEDLRSRRVLLVHWNFECGFCDSIAADLAHLETGFEKHKVQLLLLAHGEARANQEGASEHGLKCPTLLVKDREEVGPFEHEGTPVAYLLNEQGRVAAPVARGADRVFPLALELAGPQPEASATERSGVPSEPAPAKKPHLHRVSLRDFFSSTRSG